MSRKAIGRATMMLDAERACACSARASRSTSCAAVTDDSRSVKRGTSSPPPGRGMSTAAAIISNSGSLIRSRASLQACLRPIDLAAMSRNSARSGTGPRSASTAIAWFTLIAPVFRSCLSILVASSTASCQTPCCALERAFTTARTSYHPPAAAGTARTTRPVSAVEHKAPATAAEHSSAAMVRPSSHLQPVPDARRLSASHRARSACDSQTGTAGSGEGTRKARIAATTPSPALNAAADSIIEAVKEPRGVANLRELGPHPFGHRRGRTDAMPVAVRTQGNELLQQRPPFVETGDAAEGKQFPLPHVATPDDRRVKNQVDGVNDLGEHSLGPRRLRVALRETDQPRPGLARPGR